MQIEIRDTDTIRPYEKNPRLNDSAIDATAASIREFGFRQPIVVDTEGVIVVGHTRWKAATQLGLARIPVHVATDLTPDQIRAYRIADNQTGDIAEWDFPLLQLEIADLQDADYDLDLLGFDTDELEGILAGEDSVTDGETDPDATPEPPDEAVIVPGRVYQLGDHRLMCGDSASPEDMDKLLGGQRIHLVNTDPPYNVHVEPRSNNAIAAGLSSRPTPKRTKDLDAAGMHHQGFDLARHPGKARATHTQLRPKDRPLENDFMSDEDFEKVLNAWFANMARALEPGCSFYTWGGYANCSNYPGALKANDLHFAQAIIWVKHHPVLGRKDYMSDHEWCFYGWLKGAAHRFLGPDNARDVWEVKKVNPQQMVHLTEKPVELAVRAIQYSSKRGENVLDLFGGSGSTLIACEQTGRRAHLMEIDPLYCDVIRQRWAEFVHGEGCDWQALTPEAA